MGLFSDDLKHQALSQNEDNEHAAKQSRAGDSGIQTDPRLDGASEFAF